MIILALDTTSNTASVAIRRDGETISVVSLESDAGFAHLIFGAIEKCRNEARIMLNEVDCFASASGPGSFTGVRIGLTAAKGLAESLERPVIGISNLRALSSFGENSLRAVTIDARRSEVYAAVYDADLKVVIPETVGPLDQFLAKLDPSASYEFISAAGKVLAPAVALCAELDRDNWLDPAALDANYVRRSDAELSWKNR